jgi:hypothetical protein
MAVPNIILNNGVSMPTIGFGVFQTPPDETTVAVAEALKVGCSASAPVSQKWVCDLRRVLVSSE